MTKYNVHVYTKLMKVIFRFDLYTCILHKFCININIAVNLCYSISPSNFTYITNSHVNTVVLAFSEG